MTYQRLVYEDQDTADQMSADCTACAPRITLPARPLEAAAVAERAPSLRWADHPREVPKPVIEVSEAAAHLAARLHLHLD